MFAPCQKRRYKEYEEEHGKWAEIEDIDGMKDYLVWEAQGMRPNWRIEDCKDD